MRIRVHRGNQQVGGIGAEINGRTRRSPSPTAAPTPASPAQPLLWSTRCAHQGSRWPWHTLASNSGSWWPDLPAFPIAGRPGWSCCGGTTHRRLILLLPAAWSLWLQSPRPDGNLVMLIIIGGLAVSGAGCIANDLWDHRIDAGVARTSDRPWPAEPSPSPLPGPCCCCACSRPCWW